MQRFPIECLNSLNILRYVDTCRLAENRRHNRTFGYSIKYEYLCPLCETIGNSVMPLFPDFRQLNLESTPSSQNSLTYEDWLDGLEKTLENSVRKELQDNKGALIKFKIDLFIRNDLVFCLFVKMFL